jgi:hypothetical protein
MGALLYPLYSGQGMSLGGKENNRHLDFSQTF